MFLVLALGTFPKAASADLLTFTGTGINAGLSAKAEFTLINSTTLKIVLTNTSTSLPSYLGGGNSSSNALLTTIAFRLPGNVNITSGDAAVTAGSSLNGASGNIGKEWGWGKSGPGLCCELIDPYTQFNDWVSTKQPGTTQFKSGSLDGTSGISGPDFGLAPTNYVSGGQEYIKNSATFTLSLSGPVPDLSFLNNGAVVEYGSDAAFLTSTNINPPPPSGAPEPGAIALLGMGIAGLYRHRRRRA